MLKIIFLCTGNSCRSQVAEGLARHLGGERLDVYSAGLLPSGVNPYAVKVMDEAGIDISGQLSEAIDEALLNEMDLIITLCGDAERLCPSTPPEIRRIHWPIDDPVGAVGTEEEILDKFRLVRDEIRDRIEALLKEI